MIRFATIGTNFVADWFVKAALKVSGLHYQAVYSRNSAAAKAYAEKYGAERWCTSLEELAGASDIDAVYISSPNSLHYEQAALMLAHGKHVLCEKTITTNERELSHLIKLAKEKRVVLMEAMRSVYEPGFLWLRDNLEKVGTIRRVSFQYAKYSSRYDKFKAGIIENAFNPEFSNGALMDIGVYCVHPMVRLFGMPDRILADGLFLSNGVDGAGTILAGYNGMQADLLYSKISDNRLPSQIQGEEGTMIIDDITQIGRITFYDRMGNEEILFGGQAEYGLEWEVNEWVRLMGLSGENELPGEEYHRYSLMELRVMDEARRQMGIVFPADRSDIFAG